MLGISGIPRYIFIRKHVNTTALVKDMSKVPEPPQFKPEEWQIGMEFFEKFLKKVKIKRDGKVVHVDWIFEFTTEELAQAFVKAARVQFGGLSD